AVFVPVGNDTVPEQAFRIVNWFFFGLCIIAITARVSIRWACFRRLVFEDYLMMVALLLHSAEAILIHLFVHYLYEAEALDRGDFSSFGPDTFTHIREGLIALGVGLNCTLVGVLIIKLNFLLFFRRLGASFRRFNIAWWAVTVFTVAGTAAQIGMEPFPCLFGSIDYILGPSCTNPDALKRLFFNTVFSATVDAASDVLIILFPTIILWGSGINLRKKMILTFVFGLVFLTIAVTIVRGSISHNQYGEEGTDPVRMQSLTFTWFWFHVEFSVAFVIACVVSFRTLFVQRAAKSSAAHDERQWREAAYRSAIRNGWRYKLRQVQDSVLDTCKTLEGWSGSEAETLAMHGLPTVPSGLMTVDFNDDDNWGTKK
ncbi:hypothetical protein B0H66DRAFT_447173, partial [Apodospora peruviana]